ncbi:MAG: YHS domain-containing protein [Deltaproteobacteria bacterium]|nr:YHS domain-containing protein [Deltaproteobacteria bacterium]
MQPSPEVPQAEYQGRAYFFCAPGCRDKFLHDPGAYIKPKGWWRRYLDRLTRVNEREFGGKGPCCH